MAETELAEAVRKLATVFDERQVQYALIGGLAVGLRSRPRATQDADFIVSVPALGFPGLLESLVGQGFQIDVMDAVRRWPVDRFLAFWCGRVRVDWLQPVLPLYSTALNTATAQPWLDSQVRVATAEGLILTKLVAFRPQDQADIETLLLANRDEIDLELIRREWSAVSAGEEERTVWLENAIARNVERHTD
jgi:hypothetical protein